MIYLDHNSTSPLDADVAAKMTECFAAGYVNPASQHRLGQKARRVLEQHRRQIVETLGGCVTGMAADQLVFTSGGTESDNLALFGLSSVGQQRLIDSKRVPENTPVQILISAVEHPAVSTTGKKLAGDGFNVIQIPVNSQGVVCLESFTKLLDKPTALVSVMLANNETGAIQPVQQIAELCREANVLVHTDAVQAIGKIPVDFGQLGVDALTFTAHKFAGPRGIGGLLLRHGVAPDPMLFGGFQQTAIRPGTEDICLVMGLSVAVGKFVTNVQQYQNQLAVLRDDLQSQLEADLSNISINSGLVDRTPQTLNIGFVGINRQSFLMSADLAGLAISTGSACASGSSDPSPVLIAMGLKPDIVDSSVRISLGYSTTKNDIDQASAIITKIVKRSR